jgi:hypothetical protein
MACTKQTESTLFVSVNVPSMSKTASLISLTPAATFAARAAQAAHAGQIRVPFILFDSRAFDTPTARAAPAETSRAVVRPQTPR